MSNVSQTDLLYHSRQLREKGHTLDLELIEATLPPSAIRLLAIDVAHHANVILRALDVGSNLHQQAHSEQFDALLGEGRR